MTAPPIPHHPYNELLGRHVGDGADVTLTRHRFLAFDGIAPPRNSVFTGEKFGKWVAELPVRQHWVEALGTAITRVMQGQASAHDAGCELDDKLVSLIAR